MRIKVIELLDNITAAAVDQDIDELLELRSKLEGVNRYIQSPNVSPWAFIQIVDEILRLLPDAARVEGLLMSVKCWPDTGHGMAFDVGVALFHIAEATRNQDRAGLQKMQIDFRSIEELIYGKLNEPPSAFAKLIEAILEILPDAEVKTESVEKIEELEEPAGPIERIEEPLPAPAAPTAEKRSLAARLWKN